MNFTLPSIGVNNFSGGLNDAKNQFALKGNQLSEAWNVVVYQKSIEKRPGYTPRIATAMSGATTVTGVGQFRDSSYTRRFVCTHNGTLYLDNAGTWAEKMPSSGVTISTSALCSLIPAERAIVGVDQTNPPFIYNGTGDCSVLNPNINRASCGMFHKGFFILGDTTWTGTREYSTVRNSILGNVQNFEDGKSDTNRKSQVRCLIPTADYGLIFLDDEVWYMVFSPSESFTFSYKVLDPGVGIVGPMAACNVPGQATFFWGRGQGKHGPYIISEDPLSKPRYVGDRISQFIDGIDTNYLANIVTVSFPSKYGVLFNVPYGSSQATNNYAIFYNYADDAFSIWKNPTAAYAFASGVVVDDSDSADWLYCGGYDGLVQKVGTGVADNGNGYTSEVWTPWYGKMGVENLWLQLRLYMDLGQRKTLSVKSRFFNQSAEYSQAIVGGAPGTPIGEFIIGVSALAGEASGVLVGDIYGETSEFIQVGIMDETINESFRLHGLGVTYERASSWAKMAS